MATHLRPLSGPCSSSWGSDGALRCDTFPALDTHSYCPRSSCTADGKMNTEY